MSELEVKELIEVNILKDIEFRKIKIVYLRNDNQEFEQQEFNDVEKFSDWYKQQNFSLFPSISRLGEYQYKIKLFCSWETREYLENNFEFSNKLSSLCSHTNVIDLKKITDMLNLELIDEIKLAVNEKIKSIIRNPIPSLLSNSSKDKIEAFYTNEYLNRILDFVLKMNKIQKQIENNKDNKDLILILLDSWIVKFYEICHNPHKSDHISFYKCNDFYGKYFLELSKLNKELNSIANYVWDDKKSWVYLARNKSGIVHPIDFNNENNNFVFKNNLLYTIYQNDRKNGLKKIINFIKNVNQICINLCSLYFSIRSNLMHTKYSKYYSIDFEKAKAFLFYLYL